MQRHTNAVAHLAGILTALLTGGCWSFTLEPVQAPYITRESPYVAILQFPYKRNEQVLDLTVWEELGARYDHTLSFSTCWRIKAAQGVPAAGFHVQIGHIPEGFMQLVPRDQEEFTPILGHKYVLIITTTNRRAHYSTWWAP